MWFPEKKTSIGLFDSSAKSSLVSPNPPAAFSMLTTVKSIRRLSISGSSASSRARRPGEPTTSPTKRRFMAGLPARSPCVLDGAGLADHGHLDLAGVLELG